jgi:hypothetical protein
MKTIPVILILTLTACSNLPDKEVNGNGRDSFVQASNTLNYAIKDTLGTSGHREYRDSANFSIIRGKYASGAKFIDVYQNKLTRLDHWKAYHENGQLKEEGEMTNGNHIYVGVWKYYSANGRLDSLVDHDLRYKIPYFKALEISALYGYKMPDMEVSLAVDKEKTYWQIAHWPENSGNSGRTAESILIDIKTGRVTKPGYQLMRIH